MSHLGGIAERDSLSFAQQTIQLKPFLPLSDTQNRTLINNFDKQGCIFKPIDVHTMLDCEPERTMHHENIDDIDDDTKLIRPPRAIFRQEFFGATLYDLDNHAMVFMDQIGALIVAHMYNGITLRELVGLLMERRYSRAQIIDSAIDLLSAGALKCGLASPQTLFRFVPAVDLREPFLQSPFAVELELTHGCYRACRHCAYNSSPTADRTNELDTTQWKRAIQKLVNGGVMELRFTGGDVLFRRDALELFSYADDLDVRFHFLSDTIALNPRSIDAVRRFRNLSFIGTSIDGTNAETHDWMRGDGAFATLCSRIECLAEAGFKISLGATLHKKNWRTVREMGRVATAHGATYFELGFLSPVGRGEQMSDYVLDGPEVRSALDLYLEGIAAGEFIPLQSHYLRRVTQPDPFADISEFIDRLPYQTEWPFSRLRIKPNGESYTAGKLRNTRLSQGTNILRDDLSAIWRLSPNLKYLREVGAGRRQHSLDITMLAERGIGYE